MHISLLALKWLGVDQVWWVVSPQNPLKPSKGMAPLAQRMAGARAMAQHPRIIVTAIEDELGTFYTAETLQKLKQYYGNTRFVWLMGADNLSQIPRWRHWQRIFSICTVAVFARPPYSMKSLGGLAAQKFRHRQVSGSAVHGLARRKPKAWVFLHSPLHAASSSAIRQRRAARRKATQQKG